MEVLIIDGSPRIKSNSKILIEEMTKVFSQNHVEVEIVHIGTKPIQGCIACGHCKKHEGCAFHDIVNETASKFMHSDGLIVVSPTYFASPNGSLISFLDRLFYSRYYDVRMKAAASFAIARRGGSESSFDVLNKYFTISGMPIVSGDYWNNGFGALPGEITQDEEGLRNARVVAKRMVFMIKAIKDAKEKYPELLIDEDKKRTNFI